MVTVTGQYVLNPRYKATVTEVKLQDLGYDLKNILHKCITLVTYILY